MGSSWCCSMCAQSQGSYVDNRRGAPEGSRRISAPVRVSAAAMTSWLAMCDREAARIASSMSAARYSSMVLGWRPRALRPVETPARRSTTMAGTPWRVRLGGRGVSRRTGLSGQRRRSTPERRSSVHETGATSVSGLRGRAHMWLVDHRLRPWPRFRALLSVWWWGWWHSEYWVVVAGGVVLPDGMAVDLDPGVSAEGVGAHSCRPGGPVSTCPA
jgi:hypothetical protein